MRGPPRVPSWRLATPASRPSLLPRIRVSPGDRLYPVGFPHAAGSCAGPVCDRATREVGLLTAAHVVGSLSQAFGSTDEVLLGFLGAGSALDQNVGRVIRSAPALPTDQIYVDAALVGLAPGVTGIEEIREERPNGRARDIIAQGQTHGEIVVHKRGPNGFTSGLLILEPTILRARTPGPAGPVNVVYYNGYWIHGTDDGRAFAGPGDSGSAVIDDDDCIVGMVVAVENDSGDPSTRAFYVPIVPILDELDVELIGPTRPCVA